MSTPQRISLQHFTLEIIRNAKRFTGLREVKPNAEWDNPKTPTRESMLSEELRKLMRPSPWEPGWAYCAAFCEAVVSAAIAHLGTPEQVQKFRDSMNSGVLASRNRFRELGMLSKFPSPGSIWLAQHGSTNNGHAGIVVSLTEVNLCTIEANTSLDSTDSAKDREGDWITGRVFGHSGRGTLKTVGFVTPASILQRIS